MSDEKKIAAVAICGAVAAGAVFTILPIWRYGSPITWDDHNFGIWCGMVALLTSCVVGLLVFGLVEHK